MLEYSLAGVGSRFIAGATDLMVQLSILGCAMFILALVAAGVTAGEGFVIALAAIVVFACTYGYDTAFEALRNGQTPGKDVMGIRVIRDGGLPCDFKAAAIRNLVYLVDGPLTLWIVGMLSIVITKRNQRLGDIAAGTLVIRERTGEDANRPAPAPPWAAQQAAEAAQDGAEDPVAAPTPAPVDTGGLGEQDVAVIRQFLARRTTLDLAARRSIAVQLAEKVEPLVAGVERGTDDEEFLQRVASAGDRA